MRTTMALLLGTLLGAPLLADDVILKNGRSFDNVVAEVGDSQVRIHLQGGVISLPRSAVERVNKSDSTFAEYLRRKQELQAYEMGAAGGNPAPGRAEDWLELARWARRNNLPQSAREAALAAAEIDPRAPGLAALLRGFGYVYEESLDRWISYDDSMRLHGFVQDAGAWVSREEQAERMRERAAARAAAAPGAGDAASLQAQLDAAQQGGDLGYPGYDLGGFYGYWPYGAPILATPGFGARRGFERRRPAAGFGAGHHAPRPRTPPFHAARVSRSTAVRR